MDPGAGGRAGAVHGIHEAAGALAALDELPEATAVILPVRDEAGAAVDFVFDYVNRAAASAVAVTAGELTGRSLLEVLPQIPPHVFDKLVGVLETGIPLRTQLEYGDVFASGSKFTGHVEIAVSRLADSLLVVYEDVGARARARSAEQRFGAVIEATSDWVSIADGDNNLLYVNSGGRRMVGIGLDEDITGKRIGEFSPAWARRRVLGEALAVARSSGVWRGNLARQHRDGHEIPVSQVIVARMTPDGEVDFYATIARDMTRERAAEVALRESEERFRIAFEQAPIGIALLDLQGRFVQVNDAYCKTVRRPRSNLLGLKTLTITHADDIAFTRHAIELLTSGDVPEYRFEKRYVDPAGETIWVEISGSVFRNAEGEPQYVIGMVQDLGERRVAHTLQRSMLTTQLPDIDGVELAVRYLPGSPKTEVGGDWYDVIPLPDGRVGLVMGDVVGRGIDAAATMSQLRTALRAYAVEGLQPAEVVAKLHRLVDHLRIGLSTTLVYLDLDTFTRELRYVSAGHLPVLHVPAEGPSRFLPGARSTPLGAAPSHRQIPQERLVLDPGDTVLLYTDGLVERRDDSLDRRLEALRAAVAAGPTDLQPSLEHLTTTLIEDELRVDDIAMLALRVEGPTDSFATTIRERAEELAEQRRELRAWLHGVGASAGETSDVLIAVGEACANAIEHAAAGPEAIIGVRARISGSEVVVSVRDSGTWRPAVAQTDRGHGLRLMRMLMDTVDIAINEQGTRVQLRLALAAPGPVRVTADDEPAPASVPGLTFERARGLVPVVRLQGEIDLSRVDELRPALIARVEPADPGLVLDLSGVEYLDSAGVHLLHGLARTLAGRGQMLRISAAPGAAVLRLLELVDLASSVPVDGSVAEAVKLLTPRPLI
jgi:anti-anti-sigma factor